VLQLELPFNFVSEPDCNYSRSYTYFVDSVETAVGDFPSWLSVDESLEKFTVDTDAETHNGEYTIRVDSKLNIKDDFSDSQTVELTIKVNKCGDTVLQDVTIDTFTYVIRDALTDATSVTFDEFPDTIGTCGARQYTLQSPYPDSAVTLDSASRTLRVQTDDKTLLGTHEFDMLVELVDYPLSSPLNRTFMKKLTLVISHICETTILTPIDLPPMEFLIKLPAN